LANHAAIAFVFWYGGQLVSKNKISVQAFFLVYMAIIFGGQGAGFIFGYSSSKIQGLLVIYTLTKLILGITKAHAAMNRILYMQSKNPPSAQSQTPSVEDAPYVQPLPSTPEIVFHKVQFRYPSRPDTTVLKGHQFYDKKRRQCLHSWAIRLRKINHNFSTRAFLRTKFRSNITPRN
jgi:ATP-binding cassette subfamily B (MDR/TAP) protein 1